MMYLPKSKYQKLQTSGDKFKDPTTGKPYVGPYMQTSEGSLKGHSLLSVPVYLVPLPPKPSEVVNKVILMGNYNKLKPQIYSKLNTTSTILPTKNKPTEKDYKKGSYYRYFARRNNIHPSYIEIDKKTYKSLSQSNPQYDENLHSVGKIEWALEGNVIKTNRNILFLKEKKFPLIYILFPKLNEYQIKKIKTPKRKAAPPGYHYMPNGSLMLDSEMLSTSGGSSNGGGGGY